MSKLHTSRFLFPKVNQILISSLVFCLSAPYAQTGWSIIQSPAACHVGTAEYSLKNCCAQDPMDSTPIFTEL